MRLLVNTVASSIIYGIMYYACMQMRYICTMQTALLYREVGPLQLNILLLRSNLPYFEDVMYSLGVKGLN